MKLLLKKHNTLRERLLCWLHHYHVLPALFWACLVFIGHHALPLVFDAPDQLAYTFTQTLLADQKQHRVPKQGLVALVSDKSFYSAPYYGEEPTPRCAVLESLQKIVAHEPKALVIDINLSPTYRDLFAPSKSADSASCQNRLEQFLISTATKIHVLLIDPMQFPVDSAATLESRLAWRTAMEAKGLNFGHADIQHSLLSALTQFSLTADRTDGGKRADYKTEVGMSYRLCQLVACNKKLEHDLPLKEGDHLINYAAFTKDFDSKYTESIEPADIKNRIVYFGFALQGQDQRATPIGLQYGVEIHAAYYASMQKPIKTCGWLDIIGDVLIGMFIAFWGSKLLERFVAIKKKEQARDQSVLWGWLTVRHAYVQVLWLLLFAVTAGFLVLCISYALLASPLRVWTSPIVMIFAMSLDLFCRVPFEHLQPHDASHTRKGKPRAFTSLPASICKQITTLIWHCVAWGVPLYCFWQLLNSHH